MKHLGTVIAVFVFSGGYLVAINKLKEFQSWVRTIPTDYVLTPLVILVVTAIALWNINRKQRKQLFQIQQQPQTTAHGESRFVTHFGVWWKIYPHSFYIEDFPYCPCCEPKKKLVQVDWYPDEVFKCPNTGTTIKLYDHIPRKLSNVLDNLYRSYFSGDWLAKLMNREFRRVKELHPATEELKLARRVFDIDPLNNIPKEEVEALFTRYQQPHEIFSFIERNYKFYRMYFFGED